MGCGCNSCLDQYMLPHGPAGTDGKPGLAGPKGDPGEDAGVNDGIIHSAFASESSGIGTNSYDFNKLKYTMPAKMLDKDGDTLFIKAGFYRDDPEVHAFEGDPKMVGTTDFSIHIGTEKITNEFSGVFPGWEIDRPWTADVEIYLTRINNTTFTSVCNIVKLMKFHPKFGTSPLGSGLINDNEYKHNVFYLRRNSSVDMDFNSSSYEIKASASYDGIDTPVVMLHTTIQKISKVV